jgi:hypothetical protein
MTPDQQQTQEQQRLQMAVQKLGSRFKPECRDARTILLRSGPSAVPVILAAIHQEEIRRKRKAFLAYLCLVVLSILLPAAALSTLSQNAAFILYLWTLLLCAGGLFLFPSASRREAHAIRFLARFEDKASAGPLLRLAMSRNTAIYTAAESTLSILLPLFTPEDKNLLTQDQRECLYKLLDNRTELDSLDGQADILIALLHIVAIIGDEQALPIVYKFNVRKIRTSDEYHIQVAAKRCCEKLIQRIDFGTSADIPRHIDACYLEDVQELSDDPSSRIFGMFALIRLLPQIQSAEFLDAEHWKRLYQILAKGTSRSAITRGYVGRPYPFVREILDVVERLEDTRALPAIRQLIWERKHSPLSDAAREILPRLKAKDRQERIGRTLLRGVEAPAAGEQDLLRTATKSEAVPPEELLHILRSDDS